MTSKKTKSLQAAGWKVGNVEDFLQLSDDEAKQVERKLKAVRVGTSSQVPSGLKADQGKPSSPEMIRDPVAFAVKRHWVPAFAGTTKKEVVVLNIVKDLIPWHWVDEILRASPSE